VHDKKLHRRILQDPSKKLHDTLLLPGRAVEAGAVAQAEAVQVPAEAAEKEAGGKNENRLSNESTQTFVCVRLAYNERLLHSANASFCVDFIRRRDDTSSDFARRFHI
jgi:hypothetical protein